ncbi:MAG: thiamine phosphate synthase [Oscillospiraceae bacterium]|nr:thiamine phosphate synthase [Oscillospiraceae bacterium]
MNISPENLRLYAVTDRRWLGGRSLADAVEDAIRGGVTIVQLREKTLDDDAILQEALALHPVCAKHGVPLIINDSVDVALRSGAEGVHVGHKDQNAREVRRLLGADKILGVSAATVAEAVQAEADGADYIGCGAVFPTGTKTNTRPVDHALLSAICAAVRIPVVAIGGITYENAPELRGSGIAGTAVVSAIFAQDSIEQAARALRNLEVWT